VAGLLKSIEEGNCVAFVGAGFSIAAGLPDWATLLWTLVRGLHAERVITDQEKAFLES
jgi:NAD-dependent SIR2 family protein deacetylase